MLSILFPSDAIARYQEGAGALQARDRESFARATMRASHGQTQGDPTLVPLAPSLMLLNCWTAASPISASRTLLQFQSYHGSCIQHAQDATMHSESCIKLRFRRPACSCEGVAAPLFKSSDPKPCLRMPGVPLNPRACTT